MLRNRVILKIQFSIPDFPVFQIFGSFRMSSYDPPTSTELHLLYTLSDSALPTGGFIASSGLESFAKHGFLSSSLSSSSSSSSGSAHGITITDFARAEVEHYAQTTVPFLISSFQCVEAKGKGKGKTVDHVGVIGELVKMDEYHEATLLSHVSRRSSSAQGVALLTLLSRGLTRPLGYESKSEDDGDGDGDGEGESDGDDLDGDRLEFGKGVVDGCKRLIRVGKAMGHLAICWGLMTAALGLSLGGFPSPPPLLAPSPCPPSLGQSHLLAPT